MGKTNISWSDEVWNPVTGCTKVSAGCANCYAEAVMKRFNPDEKFETVTCHPNRLNAPCRWKKPRRVFVNSMSDLFHEKVPLTFIHKVFMVMISQRHLTFMILTKRPQRAMIFFQGMMGIGAHPTPNIWLGISAENQKTLDERIPYLLQTPVRLKFLSLEPMLEPIDISTALNGTDYESIHPAEGVKWVIVGAESGPKRRPFEVRWLEEIEKQCARIWGKRTNQALFVKQDSGPFPGMQGRIPNYLWKIKEFPRVAE